VFNYALNSPGTAASTGGLGVVHCSGGLTVINGASHDRASGLAVTSPFVYATGSTTKVRVHDVGVGSSGGQWSGSLPVVRVPAGGGASVNASDGTFTTVTT
jgi:hypothetical protein